MHSLRFFFGVAVLAVAGEAIIVVTIETTASLNILFDAGPAVPDIALFWHGTAASTRYD